MEIRKAIKKIVALGIGASMLGATILGATAAASLNQYPAPFIQNGKFVGTLVVGDNAAAEDIIGVSDIAMSLQYAASVKVGSGTTATTSVEGDAYEFTKSSEKLNLWKNLNVVKETLTSSDLNALADGTFKGKTTESYIQTLKPSTAADVIWYKYSDISDDGALYLKFTGDVPAFQYKLNFGTGPQSVNESNRLTDFEDEKISILGKEYTVTKADVSTGNKPVLTLMSGAVQDTLEVGQTKTYTINGKDYEVTVMIVSGDTQDNAVAKLIINDEVTKSLSKDQTYTLKDGTDVGIKEVLPTKSGDVVQNLVEFYLGAQKLVLDGNDGSMDIGDSSSVDGASVRLSTSKSGGDTSLNAVEINFTSSSDLYVPVGGSLADSAKIEEEDDYVLILDKLGLNYKFTGLKASPTEVAQFGRNDDNSLRLKFTNKNGVEYDVPIFYMASSSSNVSLGKEAGKDLIVTQGQTICDENYFVVESDEISRVLQLKDVKNTSDTHYVKIKDVGTGDSTDYNFETDTLAADMNIDGTTYTLTVPETAGSCVTGTKLTDDGTAGGAQKVALWTKTGASFNLTNSTPASPSNLVFKENKEGQKDDDTVDAFAWNITYDSGNDVIDSGSVNPTVGTELGMQALDSDSKKLQGYSKWGTYFEEDTSGDQNEWKLTIPENEAEAQVFLTAGVTKISSGEAVEGETVIVNKIDVGATKLASEVKGMEKTSNLILVGGPCANAAVGEASADFPTCDAATWPVQAGEALIQLVEQTDGHVALLIAGTDAADTRVGAAVVADMTKLKALPAGVMKQKVSVVSGKEVLLDVPVVEETPAAEVPAEVPVVTP